MCILVYVKLIWCSGFPEIFVQLEERGTSAFCICAIFYMLKLFSVLAFQRSMLDWVGASDFGIYGFFYMWNWFGVVIFQRSMLHWGVCQPSVYVHSSICDRSYWSSHVVHRYTRWIGELPHQTCNLSHLCNLLWKVVICALLNTGFKGIWVVTYLTNIRQLKLY